MLLSTSYKGLDIEKCEVCHHAKFIDVDCKQCYRTLKIPSGYKKKKRTYNIKHWKEQNCPVCRKKYLGHGIKVYCSDDCRLWAKHGDNYKTKMA